MTVTELLGSIEAAHERLGSPLKECARRPASNATIAVAAAAIGVSPTPELLALYGWHDGIAPGDGKDSRSPNLFGRADFPGHEQAIARCLEARALAMELAAQPWGLSRDELWRDSWFPIFLGEEPAYVLDCADPTAAESPVWRVFWHPDGATEVAYPSLKDMLAEVLRRFDDGQYTWEPDRLALMYAPGPPV